MSISKKFTLSVIAAVAVISIIFAVVSGFFSAEAEHSKAKALAAQSNSNIIRLLKTSDSMVMDQVELAMEVLKLSSKSMGQPSITSNTMERRQDTANLMFGDTAAATDHSLVDTVAEKTRSSVTLFVRQGNDFIRVSTNIMQNGKRAIGTKLNDSSPAYQQVLMGNAFYGQVSILGKAYLTGYEPIKNNNNQVIGIWYVGYEADLRELEQALASIKIIKNGFAALISSEDKVLAYSSHVTPQKVNTLLSNGFNDWEVNETPFPAWNFKVITAYPRSDINGLIIAQLLQVELFIFCGALILVVILHILSRRLVIAPLSYMVDKLELLGEGDLSVRLNENREDEIGDIAKSFNRVLNRLQTSISSIAAASEQLSAASEELSASAKDSNLQVQKQTAETEQVASAMEQMSITVTEVAKNTENAAGAANNAKQQADIGSDVVANTIEKITALASQVQDTSYAITELSKASSKISTVVDEIQGIAEQTNLLALNAAIEAARAGQHGRGFAVVADEVRSLAGRTHKSTEEIQVIVDSLLNETDRTVEMMQRSETTAQDCVADAKLSKEALGSILSSVENIADRNAEVASASEQQSVVAEEISRNLTTIKHSSIQSGDNASHVGQASDELAELAIHLQDRIRFFKT